MNVRIRIAVGVVCIFNVAVPYHVANAEAIWRGVDLSYVNELDDCGVVYRLGGVEKDPYRIFSELGANVVRLRLWHTPTNEPFPTQYSGIQDVKRGIERAKYHNMRVLLDFHYSDTWADPGRQLIPQLGATQNQQASKQSCCSPTPPKHCWISIVRGFGPNLSRSATRSIPKCYASARSKRAIRSIGIARSRLSTQGCWPSGQSSVRPASRPVRSFMSHNRKTSSGGSTPRSLPAFWISTSSASATIRNGRDCPSNR